MSERESMQYDVVIVGAGPAGLACAIRLKQLKPELSVCVIEKASTVGAHILSGAVIEPGPLDALLPEWRQVAATDLRARHRGREFWLLTKTADASCRRRRSMHNHGNFIVSLGRCAPGWLRRPKPWASKSIPASPPPNRCSTTMAASPACDRRHGRRPRMGAEGPGYTPGIDIRAGSRCWPKARAAISPSS
jgi:electron-transferring-flavoprotein dehydrogenase